MMRAGEWDGDSLLCELGPGGPLSALVRATVPRGQTVAIAVPDDLDTLVATLTGRPPGRRLRGPPRRAPLRFGTAVISPCAGIFESPTGSVGPAVQIGDLLGFVSGAEVRSPFAGDLMGVLAHPGERVQAGQPIAWLRAR